MRLDDFSSLLPGDVKNKVNGHVLLLTSFADRAHSRVTVIVAGAWDGRAGTVLESDYDLEILSQVGFVPLRDRRRVSN